MAKKIQKKPLSEDLTVVFVRGNGTPRSFRVPLKQVKSFLASIGLSVLALATLSVVLVLLYSFTPSATKPENTSTSPKAETSSTPSPEAPTTNTANTNEGGSFWGKITSSDPSSPEEVQKELQGLRGDMAKLQSQLENRKNLGPEMNLSNLLQFLGPRSTAVAEAEALVQIKNAKVKREAATKDLFLDFELHNTDPSQRQVRGYIVALVKSTNFFYVYPSGAFQPKDNIALQFNRGETFAISRFRQAQAIFQNVPEAANLNFQILLFNTEGKVLASLHVDPK